MEKMQFYSAGSNNSGELCRDGDVAVPSLASKLPTENLVRFSLGAFRCAAVYSDGSVLGWGFNNNGLLGLDKKSIYQIPTKINGFTQIIDVVCGCRFTLFLSETGAVFIATNKNQSNIEEVEIGEKCTAIYGYEDPWVVGDSGNFYRLDGEDRKTLKKFSLGSSRRVKQIVAISAKKSVLLITEDGEAYGLGGVANGASYSFSEIKSLSSQTVEKIAGFYNHFVVLTIKNGIYVYGDNFYGQLGLGNKKDQSDFTELRYFSNEQHVRIVDIAAGSLFSVFVDSSGDVWTTGEGSAGRTLFEDKKERLVPEKTSIAEKAVAAYCGLYCTFVQVGGSPLLPLWNAKNPDFVPTLKLGSSSSSSSSTRTSTYSELEIIKEEALKLGREKRELMKKNEELQKMITIKDKEDPSTKEKEETQSKIEEEKQKVLKLEKQFESLTAENKKQKEENSRLKSELKTLEETMKEENSRLKSELKTLDEAMKTANEAKIKEEEKKKVDEEAQFKVKEGKQKILELEKQIELLTKENAQQKEENSRLKLELKKLEKAIKAKNETKVKEEENKKVEEEDKKISQSTKDSQEKFIPELKVINQEELESMRRVKKIGEGASAKVFKISREEFYALKIFKVEKAEEEAEEEDDEEDEEEEEEESKTKFDMDKFRRFLGEFEILNTLNHPNILKSYGICYGDKSHPPSILLEICHTNLGKSIKKLTNAERVSMIYEISSAMNCVHKSGVIHRDLKPENILISVVGSEKHVKLSDFGAAALASNAQTRTGGVGSIAFMSPEQLNNLKKYDEKIDVYAFGVLVFFILTNGKLPDISIGEVVTGKKAKIPSSVNKFSKKLIESCWSFDASERPSFGEICERIKEAKFGMIKGIEKELPRIQQLLAQLQV